MKNIIISLFFCGTSLFSQEISSWSESVKYNISPQENSIDPDAIIGISESKDYAIGDKNLSRELTKPTNDNSNSGPIPKAKTTMGPVGDGTKVALVVGNANYTKNAKLKNPINDANSIDSALRAINFTVIRVTDADYNAMRKALSQFGKEAKDADVAFFYYAGHGLQVDGENYLIPLGANIETKEQVALECLSTKLVLKTLEMTASHSRLNVMVLDACRNNPFESWSRSSGSGLSAVTPPNGTLVAYATSPGKTAADGTGGHGLYTGELIKQLVERQRIEDVFINTRVQVEYKSHGQQSPWELARLRGKYYLK